MYWISSISCWSLYYTAMNVRLYGEICLLTPNILNISLFETRYRATASARHSSIEEDTAPITEPGVWPGLYQDLIFSCVKGLMTW